MIKTRDKKSLARELKYFLGSGDSFDCLVFRLISKSQITPHNRVRLLLAFPDYVEIWEEWCSTAKEQDFFDKYNVQLN